MLGPCIDLAASRYGTVRTLQRNRRTSAIMPTGERHSAHYGLARGAPAYLPEEHVFPG